MKSIGLLLVLVVFETYLCSFMCAVGAYDCCNEPRTEKQCSKKSCCSKKESKDDKEDGCQKEHFAFLKNIGQYISIHESSLIRDFSDFLAILVPKSAIQPVSIQQDLVDYNCYHPPQAKDDVCILNQNFRI